MHTCIYKANCNGKNNNKLQPIKDTLDYIKT